MEVVTAARPTKEWKRATVWGNSVTATVLPIYKPTAPPAPMSTAAWMRTDVGKCIAAMVVAIPPATPVKPRTFPILAVGYEASPQIAPMQQTLEAR